jgi:hypothetical protein
MKQMMTIKLPPDEANLDEVRRRMKLGPEEIDKRLWCGEYRSKEKSLRRHGGGESQSEAL